MACLLQLRSWPTVALVTVLTAAACQPEVLTTGPSGDGPTPQESEAGAAATGMPAVELRAEGALPTVAPSLADATAWLEAGCKTQPEFAGDGAHGKLSGTYRAAHEAKKDASGRVVGSVFFSLRLRLGKEETYRTEAFVGQELKGADRDAALAALVKTVAGEVTANLAKQVRAARAADNELIALLGETDVDLLSFVLAEVRARKLKRAAPQVVLHLQHPNRDVVNVAAGALAEVGSRADVPALIKAGSRVDDVDRLPVLFALGELGGPDVVSYLETLADETASPVVKGAAERALVSAKARP